MTSSPRRVALARRSTDYTPVGAYRQRSECSAPLAPRTQRGARHFACASTRVADCLPSWMQQCALARCFLPSGQDLDLPRALLQ
eukprot:2060462-Prymnesium_polylepis.1